MSFPTNLIHKRVPLLAGAVLLLIAVSCGDDTTPETATATEGPDATAAAATATSEPAQNASTGAMGTVTIGDESWEFAGTTQCSVFAADTVSIAGTAASDATIEIVFDVFAADRAELAVTVGDKEWSGPTDTLQVSFDDQTASGTATVSDLTSGDTAAATFDFTCG